MKTARIKTVLAIAAMVVMMAVTVSADVPKLINVQGRVTIGDGSPVPDGAHNVWLFLYTTSSGATYVWLDEASIQTADGLFNYLLGSDPAAPLPDSIFAKYDSLFLGVVFEGQLMAPLIPLTTSPYAMRVHSIESANGGSLWGQLKLIDTTSGIPYAYMFSDLLSTSGQINVRRDPTSIGVYIMGNFDSSGKPYLWMNGNSSQVVLDLRATGNGSVKLPNGAIHSLEMANEPGVGSYINETGYAITTPTGQFTYLGSRAMFAPSDGFVLVTASAEVRIVHTLTLVDEYAFGISDNCNSLYTSSKVSLRLPGAAPAGQYAVPVSVHGLFPIDSGTTTFCFMAERLSGPDCSVENITITELFVPTAYTTVIQPAAAVSPEDPEAERAAELNFHQARLEGEVLKMREELEAIKIEMEGIRENRVVVEP